MYTFYIWFYLLDTCVTTGKQRRFAIRTPPLRLILDGFVTLAANHFAALLDLQSMKVSQLWQSVFPVLQVGEKKYRIGSYFFVWIHTNVYDDILVYIMILIMSVGNMGLILVSYQ